MNYLKLFPSFIILFGAAKIINGYNLRVGDCRLGLLHTGIGDLKPGIEILKNSLGECKYLKF